MQSVSIENAEIGMKIEKKVIYKSPKGENTLLVASGTILNEKIIRKLNMFNIKKIYVYSTKKFEIPNKEAHKIYSKCFEIISKIYENSKQGNLDISITDLMFCSQELISYIKKDYSSFLNITGLKDPENYVTYHCVDVAIYSIMLGLKMKLTEMELLFLAMGALIHDIGMIKVPKEILNKTDKLSEDEYNLIRSHTNISEEIRRSYPDFGIFIPNIISQHHERWNGEGYPNKLKAMKIDKLARIVAISDVYDAMTSERIYRHGILPHEAAEYILARSYFDFDPLNAIKFISDVISYPIGSKLLLSTGEIGQVVCNNSSENRFRPQLEIFASEDNIEIETPYPLDLSKRYDITIVSILD